MCNESEAFLKNIIDSLQGKRPLENCVTLRELRAFERSENDFINESEKL